MKRCILLMSHSRTFRAAAIAVFLCQIPVLRASEPDNAQTPLAHRGLCLEAPENTLVAFQMALDAGYGFELDVWASKDGHPVIIHDATLDRTTDGAGMVSDKTLAELKALDAGSWFDAEFRAERIPTLDESLALVAEDPRKDLTIALHMKEFSPALLEQTVRLVAKHDLFERTFAFGQTPEDSRRMKDIDSRMQSVLADFSDARDYKNAEIWSQVIAEPNCDGVWIHFIPTAGQMQQAREKNVPVYLYTASQDTDYWRVGNKAGVIFCSNFVKELSDAVAASNSD